jgi:predicted nucleic acid-binding protein
LKLVVDASVAVKWFFPDAVVEADADKAADLLRSIRDGRVDLVQPPHWFAEVIAVIARLRPDVAVEAIDLLDSMELQTIGDAAIYKRAAQLGLRLDQHLLDTLYHAVAMEEDAVLLTADERYLRKARALGRIMRLNDWIPPPVST